MAPFSLLCSCAPLHTPHQMSFGVGEGGSTERGCTLVVGWGHTPALCTHNNAHTTSPGPPFIRLAIYTAALPRLDPRGISGALPPLRQSLAHDDNCGCCSTTHQTLPVPMLVGLKSSAHTTERLTLSHCSQLQACVDANDFKYRE